MISRIIKVLVRVITKTSSNNCLIYSHPTCIARGGSKKRGFCCFLRCMVKTFANLVPYHIGKHTTCCLEEIYGPLHLDNRPYTCLSCWKFAPECRLGEILLKLLVSRESVIILVFFELVCDKMFTMALRKIGFAG